MKSLLLLGGVSFYISHYTCREYPPLDQANSFPGSLISLISLCGAVRCETLGTRLWIKVVKHSFHSVLFLMHAIQHASTQQSFYLFNAHTICAIFFIIEHSELNGFSPLLQRYVTKCQCKEPSNSQIFLCDQKNPVRCNACVERQKVATECGMAFSEICLFLENHSLEFQDIWHKNTLQNKKLEL